MKNAASQKEPWLLAVCPTMAHLPAKSVVKLYAQRMQIEEAFRGLKSERVGMGLSANKSRSKTRISVLLLIADLALLVLRWIGQLAAANQLAPHCQSNTRRSRAVLSVITLGRLLVRKRLDASFTAADFKGAQRALQQSCAELPV